MVTWLTGKHLPALCAVCALCTFVRIAGTVTQVCALCTIVRMFTMLALCALVRTVCIVGTVSICMQWSHGVQWCSGAGIVFALVLVAIVQVRG